MSEQYYQPGLIVSTRETHEGELFYSTEAAWELELVAMPQQALTLAGCGDEITGTVRAFGTGYAVEVFKSGVLLGYAPVDVAGSIIGGIAERGPGILSGTVILTDDCKIRIYLILFAEGGDVPGTGAGRRHAEPETCADEVISVIPVDLDARAGAVN